MSDETKTQVVTEGATQEVAQQPEAQAAEDERFDTEYVRKLRAEAAEYRKRLRELEGKVKADEEAKLTEQERLQKRLAELERQQAEWERERQEIILQRTVENVALRMGIKYPDVAWKLIDLAKVDFDDGGTPTNIEALLKEVIQKYPEIANNSHFARNAGAGSGNAVRATIDMNDWIRKRAGR